jgi:hypothetical protein
MTHWGELNFASLRAQISNFTFVASKAQSSQVAIIVLEDGVGERTIMWKRDPRCNIPLISCSAS